MVCKKLLCAEGLPVVDWVCLHAGNIHPTYEDLVKQLGEKLFIKAANLGSSVGVYYVEDKIGFDKGLSQAFCYDDMLAEKLTIKPMKLECAVLFGHEKWFNPGWRNFSERCIPDYDANIFNQIELLLISPQTFHPNSRTIGI